MSRLPIKVYVRKSEYTNELLADRKPSIIANQEVYIRKETVLEELGSALKGIRATSEEWDAISKLLYKIQAL